MKTMIPRDLPLPEDCRVRLVDLPVQAGGLIAVDESGFVNIYLNARLSREAQLRALQHELRHHYRGDLYSDEDIKTVEREADAPISQVNDSAPLESPPDDFDPEGFKKIGKGIYLPTGKRLTQAAAHIDQLRWLLLEACQIYDVMQSPPLLSRDNLSELAGALDAGDIAFVTWQNADGHSPAVLHFSRENLYGAIYYGAEDLPDNALAVMIVDDIRLVVDIRRRNKRLDVCGIVREIGDRVEKIY